MRTIRVADIAAALADHATDPYREWAFAARTGRAMQRRIERRLARRDRLAAARVRGRRES